MRLALEVFEETGDQQALDRAVAAALEAVQILRQLDSVHCPDAGEVSWLTLVLPDLRDLARVLVSQAEDAAQTYLDSLLADARLGHRTARVGRGGAHDRPDTGRVSPCSPRGAAVSALCQPACTGCRPSDGRQRS